MADSWWRDGFLMRAWSTLKPFFGSQILCIMCAHKCKNLYAKISKNGPNIWAHCGQRWAQNYNSALTDTRHSGIMWNIPYLITGKIPKIKRFSWLNFISTYRAQVCAQKILRFRMSMKSAVKLKHCQPWLHKAHSLNRRSLILASEKLQFRSHRYIARWDPLPSACLIF